MSLERQARRHDGCKGEAAEVPAGIVGTAGAPCCRRSPQDGPKSLHTLPLTGLGRPDLRLLPPTGCHVMIRTCLKSDPRRGRTPVEEETQCPQGPRHTDANLGLCAMAQCAVLPSAFALPAGGQARNFATDLFRRSGRPGPTVPACSWRNPSAFPDRRRRS